MGSAYFRLLMMFAMMGATMDSHLSGRHSGFRELSLEEQEELLRVRKQKAEERKKQQGLTEWHIRGVRVWALNKQNALRKAEKLLQELKKLDDEATGKETETDRLP